MARRRWSFWRQVVLDRVIKWQVRHYQRCFNTFMLLYGLVLSVLIFKFAFSFKPQGLELDEHEQMLEAGDPQPGVGALLPNIDAMETARQALHSEEIKWMSAPFFPRALNKTDHDRYIDLLRALSQLFIQNNVTFIMCDGTLLGSYLSHGMLPWDDDVDLMVRYSDINKIKNIFSNVSIWRKYQILGYHDDINEYDYSLLTEGAYLKDGDPATVYEEDSRPETLIANDKAGAVIDANKNDIIFNYRPYADYTESFQFQDAKENSTHQRYHKFKFFYRNAPFAGNLSWKWPFIDVKYYQENRTHVWTLDKRSKWVPRNIFYPLHMRPFASMWLPAPRDTRSFLRNKYGRFRCRNSGWNHRLERRQTAKKVRCWRLHSYYPFVWRDQSPAGVIESLMQDSRAIHSVVVAENFHTWQRQFEL